MNIPFKKIWTAVKPIVKEAVLVAMEKIIEKGSDKFLGSSGNSQKANGRHQSKSRHTYSKRYRNKNYNKGRTH